MNEIFGIGCFRQAEEAALGFINEELGMAVSRRMIIPIKRLIGECNAHMERVDICCPPARRLGAAAEANPGMAVGFTAKDRSLLEPGAKYGAIFERIFTENGYINFILKDEFLLAAAERSLEGLNIGRINAHIRLPDSPEYVHARLCGYAAVNRNSAPGRMQHAAAVLALAALDEADANKRHRLIDAVRKAALVAFKEGKGFNSSLAGLAAAVINNEIKQNWR